MNEELAISNEPPLSDALQICRALNLTIDGATPIIGVMAAMRLTECIECEQPMIYQKALFGCCSKECLKARKKARRFSDSFEG